MEIKVSINGSNVVFPDQQPRVINNRTLVPVRAVFESLGSNFEVEWTPGSGADPKGTVTITNSCYTITIVEGASSFTTNGKTYSHPDEVASIAVGGRIMIPIRGVLESIGCKVGWDDASNTVVVSTNLCGYYKIRNSNNMYITSYNPAVSSNNPLPVSELNNNNDTQIWKIELSTQSGKYHIRPVANLDVALNVYQKGVYPCTLQPTTDNIGDTSFLIESIPGDYYTIQWPADNNTRYLSDDGASTLWLKTSNPQAWRLEAVEYPATFEVKNNTVYKIAAYAGEATADALNSTDYSLKYLTVSPTETNDHRNVFISNSNSNNTWKVVFSNNLAKLLVADDETYGLNYYYHSKSNLGNPDICDAYPHKDNEDAFMEFQFPSDESHLPICRIHLVRSDTDLYLTADNDVNGAGVSWDSLDTDNPNKQLWHLVPINNINNDGNSSNENESISPHFCWPTESHTITCAFKADNPNKHTGIDIAPLVANQVGEPIYAIADGVVERRFEWNTTDPITGNGSMGRCLFIKHSKTDTNTDYYMRSMYMHLDQMYVSNGQIVHKGDIIGTMGYTGNCVSQYGGNGTHLHFELRIKDTEFSGGSYSSGTPVNPCDNVYEYFDHN